MWLELEHTHSNNGIVKIENELKAEQVKLGQLHEETKAQVTVRKGQSKALDDHDQANE